MNINRRELMKLSGMGVAGLAVTAPKIRSVFVLVGQCPAVQADVLRGHRTEHKQLKNPQRPNVRCSAE